MALDRGGSLRIYLGAAPGVGKTVALLDEGRRRAARGTDVVVARADTRGRPGTAAHLGNLPVVPAPPAPDGGPTGPMDLAAVLARRPALALVDDLGATWVRDGHRQFRWQEVEALLDAGIDVVATLDVAAVESLVATVEDLTGRCPEERVPDTFLDRADQIELIDMTPEAVRRRLAHGNIMAPDALDTGTARRFDPEVLTALRELALVWLADRLKPGPGDGPGGGPPSGRERILVALSGAPDGERLIRRAARLSAGAGRGGGRGLLGVVVRTRPFDTATVDRLHEQRRLLEQLGGVYHEVVADDVADALAHLARTEGVTQLVLGASPRNRFGRSLLAELAGKAQGVDLHVVGGTPPPRRRPGLRLPNPGRQWGAVGLALALLPLVTGALKVTRDQHSLSIALLAYVVVVVGVTSVGGAVVGFGCAVAAFFCANYFFTQPLHTFTVRDGDDALALAAFLLVAAIVSILVNVERRRAAEAQASGQEAAAVAQAAVLLARSSDPVDALVDHLSRALGGGRWRWNPAPATIRGAAVPP